MSGSRVRKVFAYTMRSTERMEIKRKTGRNWKAVIRISKVNEIATN